MALGEEVKGESSACLCGALQLSEDHEPPVEFAAKRCGTSKVAPVSLAQRRLSKMSRLGLSAGV